MLSPKRSQRHFGPIPRRSNGASGNVEPPEPGLLRALRLGHQGKDRGRLAVRRLVAHDPL